MSRLHSAALIVAATATLLALSGCTGVPVPDKTTDTAVVESPAAKPSATDDVEPDAREIEYDAAIADWPEALPDGYSWPAWSDLPHINGGQLLEADNAQGVYRCILLDAAWHAYFEQNDAVASLDYATRADTYFIPDNPSIRLVVVDGSIDAVELGSSNGICRGISGELPHS